MPALVAARLGDAPFPVYLSKDPGDVTALDGLESEADIGTRFESERAAISEASKKVCHSMIPHALALRLEIDKALAKLAKRLEDRDTTECKKLGIQAEWGADTRLVQAVRIQFHRRTIDLNRFARLKPTALCSPVVKSMFEDFLDLSSW
jgi:hypothetical protein